MARVLKRRLVKVGDKFSRWTVTEILPGKKWYFTCECGRSSFATVSNVIQGGSTQCKVCARSIVLSSVRKKLGLSKPVYDKLAHAARSAVIRCTNPDYPQWKDYGGRGIVVHSPWVESLAGFVEYLATLPGHDDHRLVIDRIDNDGGYVPGNLRFVDRSISIRNRRPVRRNLA